MSSNAKSETRVESRHDFELVTRLASGLVKAFHPFCEVVIHDFADLEHSIIFIEGNITGRTVGGPATDLLLNRVRRGETGEDLFNYRTKLPGGHVLKSTTIFLRDESGLAYGAFCINFDTSIFLDFRRQLDEFIAVSERDDISEFFADDIQETIQAIVSDTLSEMGKGRAVMNRDIKVELIARLNDKGVFQVKKSVPILADQLGLSRATVYNYLKESQEGERKESQRDGAKK